MSEIIVGLDLELNQRDTGAKIIEIGICIADLNSRKILEKKRFLVNPEEEITDYITKLTTITQSQVANRPNLALVWDEVKEYLKPFNIKKQPVTWGGGDCWALKKELMSMGRGFGDDWIFGYTEMNVKTVVQAILAARGLKTQGGLAKSMNKFGLRFQGTKHVAADDAENTIRIYFHLLYLLQKI